MSDDLVKRLRNYVETGGPALYTLLREAADALETSRADCETLNIVIAELEAKLAPSLPSDEAMEAYAKKIADRNVPQDSPNFEELHSAINFGVTEGWLACASHQQAQANCPRCGDMFYHPKTIIEDLKQRAAEWEEEAKRWEAKATQQAQAKELAPFNEKAAEAAYLDYSDEWKGCTPDQFVYAARWQHAQTAKVIADLKQGTYREILNQEKAYLQTSLNASRKVIAEKDAEIIELQSLLDKSRADATDFMGRMKAHAKVVAEMQEHSQRKNTKIADQRDEITRLRSALEHLELEVKDLKRKLKAADHLHRESRDTAEKTRGDLEGK